MPSNVEATAGRHTTMLICTQCTCEFSFFLLDLFSVFCKNWIGFSVVIGRKIYCLIEFIVWMPTQITLSNCNFHWEKKKTLSPSTSRNKKKLNSAERLTSTLKLQNRTNNNNTLKCTVTMLHRKVGFNISRPLLLPRMSIAQVISLHVILLSYHSECVDFLLTRIFFDLLPKKLFGRKQNETK